MSFHLRALASRIGVLLGACLAASGLASCSEDKPLTQIVVIVDSDFSGLTRIEADIRGFEERKTVTAELEDAALPRQFSLVHDGGPLGPMSVTLRAYADDDDEPLLVEPRTHMFFVPGKTLLLKIDLLAACIGLCDELEACIDPGECVSSRDAAELIPWTGPPDGLTVGGPFDAGMDSGMGSPDGAMEDADIRDADPDALDPDLDSTTPDADADADADAADGSDEGPPDGAEDTGMPDPIWPFEPGNVDVDDPDIVGLERHDVVLDCGLVEINSTDVTASGFCDDPPPEMAVIDLPADGGEALVVVMSSLQIALDSTLRLRGDRPVILLVEGDVSIAGTLDASAEGSVAGPGAGRGCELSTGAVGISNGIAGGSGASGGGGGGFGSAGGASGVSNTTASAAGGAATTGAAATLTPLRGGCTGGASGVDASGSVAALGGGGGGAVQLSVAGALTLNGAIRAAGGGGSPGSGFQDGGGGGGSGGAIALEAQTLTIDPAAVIAVNGGAGGGGQLTTGDLTLSTSGQDGTASTLPATPGTGNGSGGDGGAGAAIAAPAGAGQDGAGYLCPLVCNYGGSGGGAGGVGRIELRGLSTCAPGGVFSPAPVVECEECGACPAPPEPWCVARTQSTQLYAVCSAAQTWANARAACQSVGMDLVMITDQPENEFLISQIPAGTWYWIGAEDIGSDDWRWVIGNSPFWLGDDSGEAVGDAFTAWRSGDPQGNGPCGRLRDDGWSDQTCDTTYGYICEQ